MDTSKHAPKEDPSTKFKKVKDTITSMLNDQRENFSILFGGCLVIKDITNKILSINNLLTHIADVGVQFQDAEQAHSRICWLAKKFCPSIKVSTQRLSSIDEMVSKFDKEARQLLESNRNILNGIGIAIVVANLVVLGNLIEHLFNKKAKIKNFVNRLEGFVKELHDLKDSRSGNKALEIFRLSNKVDELICEIRDYKDSLSKKSKWSFLTGALGIAFGLLGGNSMIALRLLCGVLGSISIGASATFKLSEKEVERIYQSALVLKKELVEQTEILLSSEI